MRLKRPALAVLGLAVTSVLLTPASAPAATDQVGREQAPCSVVVGAIDAGGASRLHTLTASNPPNATSVFTPPYGATRDSATFHDSAPDVWDGLLLSGSELHRGKLVFDRSAGTFQFGRSKVGGGWGSFSSIETADGRAALTLYGLRTDGTLFRWVQSGNSFRALGSARGFSAVKTITTISETAGYDTLLATTHGGALYTIRIPVAAAMTTVVKQVRRSTWQGFEELVAERCGSSSTLLTALDYDSGVAYLYAVGHANGPSTVIKSLGSVIGISGPANYRLVSKAGKLFGE